MLRNSKSILGACFLIAVTSAGHAGGVIINEIMYHTASGNLLESYVELVNTGPSTVNLAGWRFSKGIEFSFPTNTMLAPGAYLVVAADSASFANAHPGVTNFVAGWLAPAGTDLQLEDASGQLVNEVQYSNEGDWAVRQMGPVMYNHQGWEWFAAHDGGGSSLELINSTLGNSYAQNWTSSAPGGTPGRANSVASTNVAPFIVGVSHTPIIPQPTDVVAVKARIVDEHTNGLTVTVFYRDATTTNPPAFSSILMSDDGLHADGLASDGIFGAILPARPNSTVVEFYLQASDSEGNVRTYPDVIPPTNSLRTANLLYQVDSSVYNGSQPVYRIIMTEMERAELYALGRQCPDSDSDADMNATWITMDGVASGGGTTQVRYNVGVRNRGHGTRQSNPNNYHVNIPGDRLWKKQAGINLNSQFAFVQLVGSAVFRRLEVPMADSRAVQLRVNGTNIMSLPGLPDNNSFGSYAANEQYNNDFVKRSFPLDSQGNSYRGIRQAALCDPLYANSVADLTWHGADFAQAVYTNAYFKQNHFVENDWSDLIDLIAVLNTANGYLATNYQADVQRRLNLEEWMRYMAINTLLDNDETCLANGVGDDYALYRGTNDTRFLALPYDLDTLMGRGQTAFPPGHSIFRMTSLPAMDRFMKIPEFVRVYYRQLKELADTAFSPAQMNPLLDQLLNNYIPDTTIETMKAFNAAQVSNVLSQIPLALTVQSPLPVQSGYYRTTVPTAALNGFANVMDTASVLVNGQSAAWTAWQGTWTNTNVALQPGINRILIQSLNTNGVETAHTNVDVWFDDGSVQTVGGTIAADTTWAAAGGPYNVTSSLTIASGATLTIEPGTTVYLGAGVNFTVANGGRLLAEGTASAPIRFTVAPGSGVNWGGLTINGAVGSPETRIAYAYFDGNATTPCIEVAGGTLYLDHTTFGTTTHAYVWLDSASFLISRCVFPTSTAPFELLHGTGGIKSGGRGIIRECFFGTTTGYNDVMDFTGGNRDLGQPIIQYYNNVFIGGSDDQLDLDGTDAWIEGNIFMHCHKGPGTPDSSSAVSGGDDSGNTSEITIIGNLFFDCDNAATAKQGNFFTLLNNTIVHQNHSAGIDTAGGVVNVRDFPDGGQPTTFGRGYYLEGNIIVDAEQLVRNYDSTQVTVTFNNNLLPFAWSGPGTNNIVGDPLLRYIPQVSETFFATWEDAQVLRDWFSLLPGSPARGIGPNGRDLGGVIPFGASVSGEPYGTTFRNSATLAVGSVMNGYGIPVAGFPNGSGFTHYQWKLDNGTFSAETPTATPIVLAGLTSGPHVVNVVGKNDALLYQNDPALGPEAVFTLSRTWTVDPLFSQLRINEVMAKNVSAVPNVESFPDMIELYNDSATPRDLSGMGITDDTAARYKFTFPAGTILGAGQYLVLYADSNSATPGIHLGFGLNDNGDAVYLYDAAIKGGALLDSVVFGIQLPDLSIGRMADGSWALCKPTFGFTNSAQAFGDPHHLKINEWLADAQFQANNDFIELYNQDSVPVPIGGLYFSDAAGAPDRSPIPALSFMPAGGFATFIADGQPNQGANHVNFKLSPDVGMILLSDAALNTIDVVTYGPQRTDVSQGRTPNGGTTFAEFTQPTPGGGNPSNGGGGTNIVQQTIHLLPMTASWKYNQRDNLNGVNWFATNYNDSALHWSNSSPALLYYTPRPQNITAAPLKTQLVLTNSSGSDIPTFYFRTTFNVTTNLAGAGLAISTVLDDGAIIYLNGSELLRIGMPAGPVGYTNYAARTVSDAAAETFNVPAPNLFLGTNVVAVEVHNVNATSSDICWGMSIDATISTTNIITPTQVVLNEVLANNRTITNLNGVAADWIEIFNPATNVADLSDMSLTDDPATPRRWVFPANTTIAASGYLVVNFDDNSPAGPANTGFKLKAHGDSVYLFDKPANGGSRLDGLTFGLQAPDFSVGRLPDGTGGWNLCVPSPGAANVAAALGAVSSLDVNEWMASNPNGSDWFEVHNSDPLPVPLGGLYVSSDLNNATQSPIPPLSFIGSGSGGFVQFLADKNTGSGADHVNFKLSKSGGAIGIFSSTGILIDGVAYGPQQSAVSQGRFPDGSTNIVSFVTSPTPEDSNFLPLSNVVVNEVLSHTDPPFEDAIELSNPGPGILNIGGWFLSNAQQDLKKYRIAEGTSIPVGGYRVFYQYQFDPGDGSSIPFTLNSAHGDQVYLSQADALGALTGYRAVAKFGAAAHGVSFGSYTNSVGQVDFVAMSALSFGVNNPATTNEFETGLGAPNSYPRVGPIVFNEIQYFPPMSGTNDNVQDEYIELRNISASTVTLFDPSATTNTWSIQGGVDYFFPQGISLAAGGYLLVVGFDPILNPSALAEFRSRYNPDTNVAILGPYNGHLNNTGESLSLYRPDQPQLPPHPDAGFVPQILVERIDYSSLAPWPSGASGTGSTLQRQVGNNYGNDPANWQSAAPTAGRSNGSSPGDADGDGLPDAWEIQYFGAIDDPRATPYADPDGDGFNNLQEYLAGTNPTDANNYLKIDSVVVSNGTTSIQFTAIAGRTYSVIYRDDVANGAWLKLADVPAQGATGPFSVNDSSTSVGGTRFYRLVTP